MNTIRQRLISLRSRASDLQTSLRRWAACADALASDVKDRFLRNLTPAEREELNHDLDTTRRRLQPVKVHIEILSTWYNFLLESIEEQLEKARELLDQGRNHECLAILADVEARMIIPNRDTLAFATRSFAQRVSPTTTHRMIALDAMIRSLYLPTVKCVHQRGLLPKECLSRTPLAVLAGNEYESGATWRHHAMASAALGRFIPISLVAVPLQNLGDPWNLVSLAHEVGLQLYGDLDLAWELANKLANDATQAGVSPQTAPLWARWHETLFADVFGVLQLGPAYVSGMIETLAATPGYAAVMPASDAAPPPYIRCHIALQTLQLLSYADEARERFNQIHVLCGDPNQLSQQFGPVWMQLVNEARGIAGLIAFSPLTKLGEARVIDVAPPFLSNECGAATRVRDLLLGGDESCTDDTSYTWAVGVRDVAPHLALAGLRMAFDAAPQSDSALRLRTRFGCLMQFLTRETTPNREREDREYAPGQETLKSIARRAVPAMA